MRNESIFRRVYGSGLRSRLRPRHIARVAANELRMLFAPIIIPRLSMRHRSFELAGVPCSYFLHRYNTTWRNERCVELAAVSAFLDSVEPGPFLEFGHVLSHYGLGVPDVIVDLYERGDRVHNTDIVDFSSSSTFQTIVSISTIEHVGWDEKPQSATKTREAMDVLVSLLSPGGRLFITAPTGYNPHLDEMVQRGIPGTYRQHFFVRRGNDWIASPSFAAEPYGSRGPGAASLWMAEIVSSL